MNSTRQRAILTGVVATLILAGTALAANSGWTVVSSPNVTNANYLYGSAAISASSAWAVGYMYNRSIQSTLTERWNGTDWSVVPSPNPDTQGRCGAGYSGNALTGVSAASANDVWAVGSICGWEPQTLAEHWTGTKWAVVSTPNESGAQNSMLAGVAAVSSNDVWAVGNFQQGGGVYQWNTLIEHWDGTQWTIVNSPNVTGADRNILNAVAAVSSTDIWAVGYSETNITDVPLIEHYDGQSWSIVASVYPPPSAFNQLYAVAAISSDDVWAVGYENENSSGVYGGALTEHWDGTSWSLVDGPFLGSAIDLFGIAAVSSDDVWAVGDASNGALGFDDHPITEHWDGTKWSSVSTPDPGQAAELLSATTANGTVWAIGAYSATAGITLANPMTLTLKR